MACSTLLYSPYYLYVSHRRYIYAYIFVEYSVVRYCLDNRLACRRVAVEGGSAEHSGSGRFVARRSDPVVGAFRVSFYGQGCASSPPKVAGVNQGDAHRPRPYPPHAHCAHRDSNPRDAFLQRSTNATSILQQPAPNMDSRKQSRVMPSPRGARMPPPFYSNRPPTRTAENRSAAATAKDNNKKHKHKIQRPLATNKTSTNTRTIGNEQHKHRYDEQG